MRLASTRTPVCWCLWNDILEAYLLGNFRGGGRAALGDALSPLKQQQVDLLVQTRLVVCFQSGVQQQIQLPTQFVTFSNNVKRSPQYRTGNRRCQESTTQRHLRSFEEDVMRQRRRSSDAPGIAVRELDARHTQYTFSAMKPSQSLATLTKLHIRGDDGSWIRFGAAVLSRFGVETECQPLCDSLARHFHALRCGVFSEQVDDHSTPNIDSMDVQSL
mmetsp:Transcript_44445/g.117988  ORF Transcript_44445/g.117988 Transcript_44445/m.117988 type:complete len:217 (+) Transcript_44445:1415-2065(+)